MSKKKKKEVTKEMEETQAIPTFEELFGDVPTGPGSPEKQVAVDLYNSEKRKIGKIGLIDGLTELSIAITAVVAYWGTQGLGKPFLVQINSDEQEPKPQYVTVIFPKVRVPWKGMIDGRTRPYYVPGDPDYQFKAAGEVPRLVKELQPNFSELPAGSLQETLTAVIARS